jgi:hypothetical protein
VHSHEERVRIEMTETSGTGFSYTYENTSVYPSWSLWFRVPKGDYAIKVTALNQGPNGSDAVIGTRTVTHQDPTKTTMSLTSSWTYKSRPTLTIKTANTASASVRPVGTLVVKDGTKELTRRTLSAADAGTLKVWMPVLSRGKHTIRVYFKPSDGAFASSSAAKSITVK